MTLESYESRLKRHLTRYKRQRLGISLNGTWDGKSYSHILPLDLKWLNIIETIRHELGVFLGTRPKVRLHRYFHHLNSSQAMAFNLFFPFFMTHKMASGSFLNALGLEKEPVKAAEFEHVVDAERTNFDFFIELASGAQIFFEVKLSEREFGKGVDNAARQKKLSMIYRKRLEGTVLPKCLEPETFFANYQILRNLCYAKPEINSRVVFIFPKANESLRNGQDFIASAMTSAAAGNVSVLYLEDLLQTLEKSEQTANPMLAAHLSLFREKYILPA
jgi:hypothetical protein